MHTLSHKRVNIPTSEGPLRTAGDAMAPSNWTLHRSQKLCSKVRRRDGGRIGSKENSNFTNKLYTNYKNIKLKKKVYFFFFLNSYTFKTALLLGCQSVSCSARIMYNLDGIRSSSSSVTAWEASFFLDSFELKFKFLSKLKKIKTF